MANAEQIAMQTPEAKAFMDVVAKAEKGKATPAEVAMLRERLEASPDLWRACGDLGKIATNALIDGIAGKNAMLCESLHVGFTVMCKDLGADAAPALERLLIAHVAMCWLRLQQAEYHYSKQQGESVTLALAEYRERKLTTAQHRYLRACESLARVRRLALPAVQVNIGDKQINVSGK